MKLSINGLHGDDGVRSIINALLEVDLGARINFEAHMVCVAGRMTVGDASAAIERCGFEVVSIVDRTVVDAGFRLSPGRLTGVAKPVLRVHGRTP